MHDVLPLALVFAPDGYKCTVHCPLCASDVLADATTHRAICSCGAVLRVVIANVLHGVRVGSKE